MKKVAFYIDLPNKLECDNILIANPGIGGSEYQLLQIVSLLSMRNNNISVILFSTEKIYLESIDQIILVENINDSLNKAEEIMCDFFVFIHRTHIWRSGCLNNRNIKIVPWCHNILYESDLDYYQRNKNVYKILYVSKEHLDLYLDHPSYEKSIYIYNCINVSKEVLNEVQSYPFEKRGNIVTYMGAIIPVKGFHVLAKAWKDVIKAIPNAQLYVVGSGQLYDKRMELGQLGIAECQYEEEILKAFDNNGRIPNNVHFMGILGADKKDILLHTKVGVPNPSGRTETFGIGAVEMQLFGASIVTGISPGSLETTISGKICKREKEISTSIIACLKEQVSNNYSHTYEKIDNNFSQEVVVNKWEQLFIMGTLHSRNYTLKNKWYRMKFMKELLRLLKKNVPYLNFLPSLERCLLFLDKYLPSKLGY